MGDVAVRDRVRWDRVRYASVWEDADVLCEALAPVAAGGRLLSIASAGDNALALLTLDPAEVVAVDLNPAQLACVELRVAAFRHLPDDDLLPFLGVEPARGAAWRRDRYRTLLRPALSEGARAFWDRNPDSIRRGFIHQGKFERYLRAFRRYALPLVHGRRAMRELRADRPLAEQRDWYDRIWDTPRWRMLFRLFFSRAVMGRLGRDPALFTHVEGSVGERILRRTRHALRELPTRPNPYLAGIMVGNYPPEARPRYLREEHRDTIRSRLDRLRIVQGPVDAAGGRFRGFNLSDVFEYMSPGEHEAAYRALLERAEPGARLVYWNMLAPRAAPESLRGRVVPLDDLASALHARDRAWFYRALHVDEVREPAELPA